MVAGEIWSTEEMINKYIFILFLYLFLLQGCNELRINEQEEICDVSNRPLCEYNPQKAGAEIDVRIAVPYQFLYMNYINDHFYMIDEHLISICDLSEDTLKSINDVSLDIDTIYYDENEKYHYSIEDCLGLWEKHNTLTFVVSLKKQSLIDNDEFTLFYDVLSVHYDNTMQQYVDLTSDRMQLPIDTINAKQIYGYDNSTDILYVAEYDNRNCSFKIHSYKYYENLDVFKKLNPIEINDNFGYFGDCPFVYLSYNCFLLYKLYIYGQSGDSDNYLTIWNNENGVVLNTIHLNYLHLFHEPYSAFFNDKNLWLYVWDYASAKGPERKYELLKLKLL